MKPNEKIRECRESMGLSVAELAQRCGISYEELLALETYADDIYSATHLNQVRRICDVLKIGLLNLLDLECAFCRGIPYLQEYSRPPRDIICCFQEKEGVSRQFLEDQVGFFLREDLSEQMGEHFSLAAICQIAQLLFIPPQVLLGAKCEKCGR